ncbi:MAG: creatininase family protein [Acidobacteriota bacterium]
MSPQSRKKRTAAPATRRGKSGPRTRKIADLTHHAFRSLVPDRIARVILPVGTMEAHGVLPLGTDTLIPERLAERLAEPLDALIAPAMPYGITSSLLPYPGSMTLEPTTFVAVMGQIGRELARNGFREAIVLNGHGGQTDELRRVIGELWRGQGLFGMVVEWWPLAAEACRDVYGAAGGHGGVDETAAVVALAPELVEPDRMRPSLEYRVRPGLAARPAPAPILHFGDQEGSPSFDPKRASDYLERMVAAVLEAIQEVLKAWERNLTPR